MAKEGVDYDRTAMPEAYDKGRALQPGVMALWLDAIAEVLPRRPERIIDLGAGTGRFSQGLAEAYGARVIAVDPSEKMRGVLQAKVRGEDVEVRAGQAEAVPVESGWADLVFMSMVFHHIGDRAAAAGECKRVLAPGGCIAIRNATAEQLASVPLCGFFEGFEAIYLAQIPSLAATIRPFEEAGFSLICHKVLNQPTYPDWATFAERVSHRADSLLIRLPEEVFQAGFARLRAAGRPGPVTDDVDLIVLARP